MNTKLSARLACQLSIALAYLGCKQTIKYFLIRLINIDHYYILYRHLALPVKPNKCRLDYSLEMADRGTFENIVSEKDLIDLKARKEIISRVFFYQAGFKNCYIARVNGRLAYMQWLIYPDENEIIATYFRHHFYPLASSQVMLENAFTFPKFRGLGLLPSISGQLLSKARDQGYGSAVAYIRKDQLTSINEFMRMDFRMRKLVREYKFLGLTRRIL